MNITSLFIVVFVVVGCFYVLDWLIPYIQRRWLIDRNIINAVVDLGLDPSIYCPTKYPWVEGGAIYIHHVKYPEKAEVSLRTTGLFFNGSLVKLHKINKISDWRNYNFYELKLEGNDDFEFNLLFMLFLRDNQEFIPKHWGRISNNFYICFSGTLFKRKLDEYEFVCCPLLGYRRRGRGDGLYNDCAITTAFDPVLRGAYKKIIM